MYVRCVFNISKISRFNYEVMCIVDHNIRVYLLTVVKYIQFFKGCYYTGNTLFHTYETYVFCCTNVI